MYLGQWVSKVLLYTPLRWHFFKWTWSNNYWPSRTLSMAYNQSIIICVSCVTLQSIVDNRGISSDWKKLLLVNVLLGTDCCNFLLVSLHWWSGLSDSYSLGLLMHTIMNVNKPWTACAICCCKIENEYTYRKCLNSHRASVTDVNMDFPMPF